MPKKPVGRARADDLVAPNDEEGRRLLAEMEFEAWQESPEPSPLLGVTVSGDEVAGRFDGHVMAAGEVWSVRGLVRPNPATGLLRIESLTVESHGEPREVTGKVLRALNVAAIRDQVASMLLFVGDQPEIFFAPDEPISLFPPKGQPIRTELVAAADQRSRRGRPPLSDGQLEQAAIVYLTLFDRGVKCGLMQQVADELHIARTTAADRIAKARKAGFLTPAQKGRAGARPGPRLANPAR